MVEKPFYTCHNQIFYPHFHCHYKKKWQAIKTEKKKINEVLINDELNFTQPVLFERSFR